MNRTFSIVGPGRAGRSFSGALRQVGWQQLHMISGRPRRTAELSDPAELSDLASGVDLVLLTVADDAIASVAQAIEPADAVVAHVSGSRGLDVLGPHRRVASLHPLMSLPDAATGAARLLDRCVYAVDGDEAWGKTLAHEAVADLGGVSILVPDQARALYHATACVAANHLTALCQQVTDLANRVGVPPGAYWKLMATTLENITEVGPTAALTGPAARGDWQTIKGHLDALPSEEQHLYLELSKRAAAMNDQTWPSDLGESS